jgi:hypothetical protein
LVFSIELKLYGLPALAIGLFALTVASGYTGQDALGWFLGILGFTVLCIYLGLIAEAHSKAYK